MCIFENIFNVHIFLHIVLHIVLHISPHIDLNIVLHIVHIALYIVCIRIFCLQICIFQSNKIRDVLVSL